MAESDDDSSGSGEANRIRRSFHCVDDDLMEVEDSALDLLTVAGRRKEVGGDMTSEDDDSEYQTVEGRDDFGGADVSDCDDDSIVQGSPNPFSGSLPAWPPTIAANLNDNVDDCGKKRKPGIVFLSSIPPGFNVSRTTSYFSQFGRVGRVFLQPDLKERSKRKDKVARSFTEGWVEFVSKRLAKEVANNINSTQVGGKRRSKAHDATWNIKYLPGFKWTHLSERLAYENAVHHQKLRAEISQAKRETDFFRANVERSRKLALSSSTDTECQEEHSPAKKLRKNPPSRTSADPEPTAAANGKSPKRFYEFRQKETDDAIRENKKATQMAYRKVSATSRKSASSKGKKVAKRASQEQESASEDSEPLSKCLVKKRMRSRVAAPCKVPARGGKAGSKGKAKKLEGKGCGTKESSSPHIKSKGARSTIAVDARTGSLPQLKAKQGGRRKTADRTDFLKGVLAPF